METWIVDLWSAHRQLITAILLITLVALAYKQLMWLCGVRIVPDDSVGVVTKKLLHAIRFRTRAPSWRTAASADRR